MSPQPTPQVSLDGWSIDKARQPGWLMHGCMLLAVTGLSTPVLPISLKEFPHSSLPWIIFAAMATALYILWWCTRSQETFRVTVDTLEFESCTKLKRTRHLVPLIHIRAERIAYQVPGKRHRGVRIAYLEIETANEVREFGFGWSAKELTEVERQLRAALDAGHFRDPGTETDIPEEILAIRKQPERA